MQMTTTHSVKHYAKAIVVFDGAGAGAGPSIKDSAHQHKSRSEQGEYYRGDKICWKKEDLF